MTICIATMAGKDHVVVASDRMVTVGALNTEFEQNISKTNIITNNCVAAMAGNALAFLPVSNIAKANIVQQNITDIGKIAEFYRQSYILMRNQKLEQDVLARVGINMEQFIKLNRTLAPDVIANLFQAMNVYNYGLSLVSRRRLDGLTHLSDRQPRQDGNF